MAYRVVNFSPIHKIRDVPRSMELSTLRVTSNLLQSHDAKYQHSVGFLLKPLVLNGAQSRHLPRFIPWSLFQDFERPTAV